MCAFCFDVLNCTLTGGKHKIPSLFDDHEYPLFVTWKKLDRWNEYQLRGCIGTFSAVRLHHGLSSYAVTSALKDSRFSPIEHNEMKKLKCSVSLLTNFEQALDVYDWEIGKHGIWIEFNDVKTGRKRNATYLPEVCPEQEWDQDEALASLYQKAGHRGMVTEELTANTVLTRYQSSKCALTHAEYIDKPHY